MGSTVYMVLWYSTQKEGLFEVAIEICSDAVTH